MSCFFCRKCTPLSLIHPQTHALLLLLLQIADSTDADRRVVQVVVTPSQKLGLKLKGVEGGLGAGPVFIDKIEAGSAADKSGKLLVGDRVLAINGQDMTQTTPG